MVILVRKAVEKDLEVIKKMQKQNLRGVVKKSEEGKQGFLTLQTDSNVLEYVMKDVGIWIAEEDNKIIGYEFPAKLEYAKKIMYFYQPLVQIIKKIKFGGSFLNEKNTVIGGQICISKECQGKGIALLLHKKIVNEMKKQYSFLVVEIAKGNKRSLYVAVSKLGLEPIKEYDFNGERWVILAQNLRATD